MNADKPFLDTAQDTDVAWARRKENILAALKMFRVTLDAVRRHSEWVEKRHGISAVDLWILWELGQTPGLRVVDLAKTLAVPRPTLEPLLQALLQRGLVRHQASGDGPGVYFLTLDGARIADASPQFGQGVLRSAMNNMTDSDLHQLVQAMASLARHLPFMEERAAFQPMAELLRPGGPMAARSAR